MAPKNNYLDQYKDPRWQKKRLEILERDEFMCRSCTDKSTTLHVHHFFYEKGSRVWEYDNNDLITLCENCHEALHYITKHTTIGIETFSLLIRLLDELENESIRKFLESREDVNKVKEFNF